MNVRRAVASTVTGLMVLLAGITLGTAAAAPIKWVSVPLGTHQFGHMRAPDAIVLHAAPNQVGFKKEGSGCGCTDGPEGPMLFDVAPNGSIWLFDVLNHRLLMWQPGKPARRTFASTAHARRQGLRPGPRRHDLPQRRLREAAGRRQRRKPLGAQVERARPVAGSRHDR